jgi:hypothetical protein
MIKMPVNVYGCAATLVSDSKILVLGGFSEYKGNSSEVFTIDLSNGNINSLPSLKFGIWTTLPIFYSNGLINIFSTGEETDDFPNHISYSLNIPQ